MKIDANELLQILRYRRPAYTVTEEVFIEKHLMSIDGATKDRHGNVRFYIGENPPPIIFACHTDTVHRDTGMQELEVSDKGVIRVTPSGILGADDGAGCFVLIQMIKNEVPGYYFFHRGEEVGGRGSRYIVDTYRNLNKMGAVISFDRKDKTHIITFQGGRRTCSEEFAEQLGELIGLDYKANDGGTFTDSANYSDIISECTNLSIGYTSAHSWNESLDMKHVIRLTKACIQAEWDKLKFHRDPKVTEHKTYSYSKPSTGKKGGKESNDEDLWDEYYDKWCEDVGMYGGSGEDPVPHHGFLPTKY